MLREYYEVFVATITPIMGWVRPLLAEVFRSGSGYCGVVLPDVSLPKLYARERLSICMYEVYYLVAYRRGHPAAHITNDKRGKE